MKNDAFGRPFLTVLAMTILSTLNAAPARAESLVAHGLVAKVDAAIEANLDDWFALYKTCHASPELSLHEEKSAARMAGLFREAGLSVTEKVGGHGVVGLLKNGEGPVLLIRGDMDALPIIEETGLPYASQVRVKKPDGSTVGAMHACGHDMHMTILAATARTLAGLRDDWSGTILFVAQPAEEIGQGARMMLEDGLYTRFPKPQNAIALHVSHEMKVGTVGLTSGWSLANVDSVDIIIHGKGGHGAYPHDTVDPVVTAAQLVLALQTIVSRRNDPREPAVVTVGSIQGGTKHNIIPDDVRLQLTVRTYKADARKQVLDAIRQIATDVCRTAGCPKPPTVTILEDDHTPATFNHPELTAHCEKVFHQLLGAENTIHRLPSMGGEDFGRYSRDAEGVRGFMFWLGVVDEERFAASQKPGGPELPSIHSPKFRPDPLPSIRNGVRCMSSLALSLLGPGRNDR